MSATIKTKNPKAKPSKGISRDDTRPQLQRACLREYEDGLFLEVTDSFKAARIPVEITGGEQPESQAEENGQPEGFIALLPKPALKALDKSEAVVEVTDDGAVNAPGRDGDATFRAVDTPWVRFDQLWPTKPDNEFTFAVNSKVLRETAEALGCDEIELTFNLDNADSQIGYLKAIRVRPLKGEGDAMVMPIRLSR